MTNNPLSPYGPHRVQEFISALEEIRCNTPYGTDLHNSIDAAIDCMRYLSELNQPTSNAKKHPCVNCGDGWGMQTSVGFDSCHFYCSKLAKFEEEM